MPPNAPQLFLQPSISKTTVVTTTTTTTTYAPITLPPLPPPSSPKDPKNYPLLHAPLPSSLRNIQLTFPGGQRATLRSVARDGNEEDADAESEEAEAAGHGWRQLRRDEDKDSETAKVIGLAEALERYGKKREHVDDDEEDLMQGVESTSSNEDTLPPRKKARGTGSSPRPEAEPISPLPSPHGSPPPPEIPPTKQHRSTAAGAPPPFQPDLSLTTMLTLPSLLAHFTSLPPSLQSHFLLTLLRHSPLPVLRTLHSVLAPTLARDFITLLPPELVSHILGFLDFRTLARMSRVCRAWKEVVDEDPMLWRDMLKKSNMWFGGEGEAAFERFLLRRRARTVLSLAHSLPNSQPLSSTSADVGGGPYPSPRNSTVVLPGTHPTRNVPTPITPTNSYPLANPLSSISAPIRPPHPYKILYKSRHLTRTQWLPSANPTPRHISFPAHGHSVVTCLIFAPGNARHSRSTPPRGIGGGRITPPRIISASDDHCIHVYDPRTGRLEMRLKGHEGGVWALAWCGGLLVSGSTDRTVRIWELDGESDDEQSQRDGERERERGRSRASSDDEDGAEHRVGGGRLKHVFGGHTSTVRCLAVVKPEWVDIDDGNGRSHKEKWPKRPLIVTGSRDHSLRVWTLPRKGEPEFRCTTSSSHAHNSNSDLNSEGEVDATKNPYHRRHLEGHDHAVRALAARGRTLVSGSYDCTVRVWDIETGACKWVLVGHTQKVYSVVLDPPRNQTMSGSMDGTVRIWSITTGQPLHTLTGHTSLVGLLGLSPSSLVSAAADSTLRIWDPEGGELRGVLAAHTGAITCFQHDEFKVVSGSDGTLKVWDLRGWEESGNPPMGSVIGGGVGGAAPGVAGGAAGVGGIGGAAVAGGPAPPPVQPMANTTLVRDLLTGITGVWQVAFEGRWCVAASNRNDQTVLDVWDFGRGDGDVELDSMEEGVSVERWEEEEDEGVYEEGWIGEPPGGMYDDEEDEDDYDGESDIEIVGVSSSRERSRSGGAFAEDDEDDDMKSEPATTREGTEESDFGLSERQHRSSTRRSGVGGSGSGNAGSRKKGHRRQPQQQQEMNVVDEDEEMVIAATAHATSSSTPYASGSAAGSSSSLVSGSGAAGTSRTTRSSRRNPARNRWV